jgi:hypothetical protein
LPGYRAPEIFSNSPVPAIETADPQAYVEQQRAQWLAEVQANARECLPKERAELFLKLLKLTSLHRVRLDITAQLERLQPEPNLRQLSNDQLDRILAGETLADDGELPKA